MRSANDEEITKPETERPEMSDSDKALLALLRTHKQVPEITSEKQYELYSYLYRHLLLTASLTNKDDPRYGASIQAFARSSGGILAAIYRARIINWKKKKKALKPID
jgi:hypothetical protein